MASRIYQHASTANGFIAAAAVLPTSDISNPDVVFSPLYNVLWYPSAYPLPSPGPNFSTPVRVWNNPIGEGGQNPNALVHYINGQGTATYDVTHDLLFVANYSGPTLQVYATAHSMTSSSVSAANITLTITDPNVVGTPRAFELLYDAVHDRLFVSDLRSSRGGIRQFRAQAQTAVTTRPIRRLLLAARSQRPVCAAWPRVRRDERRALRRREPRREGQTIGRVDVIHNAST